MTKSLELIFDFGSPNAYLCMKALPELLDRTGADLVVTLRVFGMANDWFMAAAEAFVAGLSGILPWSRVFPGVTAPPAPRARRSGPTGS